MFLLPWGQNTGHMNAAYKPRIWSTQAVTLSIGLPLLIVLFYRVRSGKSRRLAYFVISLAIAWLGSFTICATSFYGH